MKATPARLKYILCLAGLLFIITSNTHGQELNEASIKKDLQGFWAFTADPNFTMVFQGDTALEYQIGEKMIDISKFHISKEEFDNQGLLKPKTGFYIVLEGDEEEPTEYLPIEYIDDKRLYLLISKDRMLELEKKQF